MTDGEYGTWAEWDFKKDLKVQYGIAYSCMSEYILRPDYHREVNARKALTKLMFPLFPKLYVLKDPQAVNYIAYFMRNPREYKLMELQTVFLILQRTLERLGLTKFEEFKIPKHKSYLENDN